MERDKIWVALEMEGLEHMSLEYLGDKIREFAAADISRSDIVYILMAWFNEQIKRDIFSQDEYLLEDFLNLLLVYHPAESELGCLVQIDNLINCWFDKGATENPVYTRRYLILQQEVRRFLARKGMFSQELAAPFLHNSRGGQQEKHVWALEDNAYGYQENENTDRVTVNPDQAYLTGPDGQASADAILARQHPPGTHGSSTDEDTISSLLSNTTMDPERKSGPWGPVRDTHRPPPPNYICKRCSSPGHWLQSCPTKLDPSFDIRPSVDYRCNICGREGDHFCNLCPQNPDKSSLTQQRKRMNIVGVSDTPTPTRDSNRRYRDRESSTTQARGQSRSRSPGLQHSSRGKAHDQLDDDCWAQQPRKSQSHAKKKWLGYRDWDKEGIRGEEGRLAYDDITYEDSASPSGPFSPQTPRSHGVRRRSPERKGRFHTSEDIHDWTDNFLHTLAAELPFTKAPSPDDSTSSETSVGSGLSPHDRRVWRSPFSPAVVALFQGREIPVINRQVNRKTASQMIESDERRKHTS